MAGSTNVQGEDVKKLDVLSNELFVNMLASSYTVHMMVSEENETVIEVSRGLFRFACVLNSPVENTLKKYLFGTCTPIVDPQ